MKRYKTEQETGLIAMANYIDWLEAKIRRLEREAKYNGTKQEAVKSL